MALHANSHKIFLRRKTTHLESIQKEVPDFMSRSKKYIGSYFESSTSRIVGSGLTIAEQQLLIPDIIGYTPDEREYKKKVIEFFQDMATEVPFGKGKELEIGLTVSNTKPLSKENLPISVMDFIRWRHATKHPRVAPTQEDAIGNMLVEFYVYDPKAVHEGRNKAAVTLDNANAKYLGIKNKPEIVEALLVIYKHNPDEYRDPEDKTAALSRLVNENPEVLLAAMEDSSLQTRAILRKMVEFKLVSIIDSAYYITDDKKNIGYDEDQAIAWLQDTEKNGNTITLLKQKLQEARKLAKTK